MKLRNEENPRFTLTFFNVLLYKYLNEIVVSFRYYATEGEIDGESKAS